MKQRILNTLIALDQLIYVLITLGAGQPDETLSAAAYRTEQKGKLLGRLFRPIIDFIFLAIEKNTATSLLLLKQTNSIYQRITMSDVIPNKETPIYKTILPNLSRAMFDTDLINTRITLAFAEFLWAVMLFWPGDTFNRPTYFIMSHVMSEITWGFVFLASGMVQLYIVLLNHQNRGWAKVFANWNAVLWVFVVGAAMLSVSPPPAAMAGEISLAAAAFWIWSRPLILARPAIKFNEDRRCRYPYEDIEVHKCQKD